MNVVVCLCLYIYIHYPQWFLPLKQTSSSTLPISELCYTSHQQTLQYRCKANFTALHNFKTIRKSSAKDQEPALERVIKMQEYNISPLYYEDTNISHAEFIHSFLVAQSNTRGPFL